MSGMKTAWLCMLLFSLAAIAQPLGRDALVARLNADLLPLRSPSTSEQTQVMANFATDINSHYPKGFVARNLASALTGVLEGKDLSDETLTPLTTAMLDISDLANACRPDSCDLLKSSQFRGSIEQAFTALTALHVSVPNTQNVMWLLYRAANRIAHPIVRPIPPG
jgi:hypothetical protein